MNSTTGLRPASAAPTPRPAKPCSVIGVSITRLRPELLQQALRDLVGALIFGDLLAHHEHVFVAAHLLGHGVAQRFAHGHGDHLGAFRHFGPAHGHGGRNGLGRFRRASSPRREPRVGHRRGGFAGFLLGGRVGALVAANIFAFRQNHRDRRIDGDIRAAFGHENFSERAFVRRLHFHGRLVGLDLGDHVARFDLVALFLEPLGKIALLHRGRERGHQYFGRHGRFLF